MNQTEEVKNWRLVNAALRRLGAADATIGEWRAHMLDLKYGGHEAVADLILDDRYSRMMKHIGHVLPKPRSLGL